LQAMELLGGRAQALREQLPGVGADRELAPAGAEDGALDPDDVADVDREEAPVGVVAELVHPRLDLDLAGAVLQVEERRLAVAAARGQPPGHPVAALCLLALLEAFVRLPHLSDLGAVREA